MSNEPKDRKGRKLLKRQRWAEGGRRIKNEGWGEGGWQKAEKDAEEGKSYFSDRWKSSEVKELKGPSKYKAAYEKTAIETYGEGLKSQKLVEQSAEKTYLKKGYASKKYPLTEEGKLPYRTTKTVKIRSQMLQHPEREHVYGKTRRGKDIKDSLGSTTSTTPKHAHEVEQDYEHEKVKKRRGGQKVVRKTSSFRIDPSDLYGSWSKTKKTVQKSWKDKYWNQRQRNK